MFVGGFTYIPFSLSMVNSLVYAQVYEMTLIKGTYLHMSG